MPNGPQSRRARYSKMREILREQRIASHVPPAARSRCAAATASRTISDAAKLDLGLRCPRHASACWTST